MKAALVARLILLATLVLVSSGCATATTVMKSYIGKDVREAVVDYGEPTNAFDMGDGRRAFQWTIESNEKTAISSETHSESKKHHSDAWTHSNTTISGGDFVQTKCIYTLFGRWNKTGWIISDFRKPAWDC